MKKIKYKGIRSQKVKQKFAYVEIVFMNGKKRKIELNETHKPFEISVCFPVERIKLTDKPEVFKNRYHREEKFFIDNKGKKKKIKSFIIT